MRCYAITKCTPNIVGVLQNEIGFLSLASSVGLISDPSYRTFLKQESSNQVEQLLLKVKSKIKVTLSSYDKFLKILREEKATEDLADMIEEKVRELEQLPITRRVKKVKKKGLGKDGRNSKSQGMPKLEAYEAYSSGIQSDFSSSRAGDTFPPNKSLSSGAMPIGGANNNFRSGRSEPDHADSTAVISVSPHQDTGSPSFYVPLLPRVKENRSIQNGEKASLEESGADTSIPYVAKIFANIQLGVESGKTKVEEVIANREDKISNLLKELRATYAEIERLGKEIAKRESDLKELEIKKQEEIDCLRKLYEEDLKEQRHCAVAQSDEDREKIEELQRTLVETQDEKTRREEELLADIVQKNEDIKSLKKSHDTEIKEVEKQNRDTLDVERQQTQKLEQHLQKATNEKIALEKKKGEADLKLAELRFKNSEEISAIKEKMYNLKQDAQAKIFEAEKQAQTEKTEKIKAEMQAKLDIKDAQQAAQLGIKDAQIQVHQAENDTRLLIALKEQARGFERERREIARAVCAQRSVSSSPVSQPITHEAEEHLSVSLMQMSFTRTPCSNNGQSKDDSKPNEDGKEQPFSES